MISAGMKLYAAVGCLAATLALGGVAELAEIPGLTDEEVKSRIRAIFPLIDKNADGFLDKEEMKQWTEELSQAALTKEAAADIVEADTDKDGELSMQEISKYYGEFQDSYDNNTFVERFNIVDGDGSKSLNATEFYDFTHPSGNDKLIDMESKEIIKHQDQDKDGKISLKEFEGQAEEGDEEDAAQNAADFKTFDTNADGFIDETELKTILRDSASSGDFVEEVTELIKNADDDENSSLDVEEFTKHYVDVATTKMIDYGELIRFPNDYPHLKLPYDTVEPSPADLESELEDFQSELDALKNMDLDEFAPSNATDDHSPTKTSDEL
eukprot:Filipodium_phascolosomae@DN4659_c0_g1_i1.p1